MIKFGGEKLHLKIDEIILQICKNEQMPNKRGDHKLCKNYRGITFIYKIPSVLMQRKLSSMVHTQTAHEIEIEMLFMDFQQ